MINRARQTGSPARPALAAGWVLAAGLAGLGGTWLPAAEGPAITNIAQLRQTTPAAAAQARPVQLAGTVTYADLDWNTLFVQDRTGGLRVSPRGLAASPAPGTLILITGRSRAADPFPEVAGAQFTQMGEALMPEPKAVSETDLAAGKWLDHYVETPGVVRQVELFETRAKVELLRGRTRLSCYLHPLPEQPQRLADWVGARVRARGVRAQGQEGRMGLFIPGVAHVTLVRPAMAARDIPVATVARALQAPANGDESVRVRIRGVVTAKRGPVASQNTAFVVRDDTGSISVSTSSAQPVEIDDLVEAWGFPAQYGAEPVLEDADYQTTPAPRPAGTNARPAVLRQIGQVRALSSSEAARRVPVRLQGVITYADPGWPHFFLQDATGAVFVRAWKAGLQAGRQVEVEGVSDPGGLARMVIDATVRETGPGTFPAPRRVAYSELLSEPYDCQWVELEGVARSVQEEPGHTTLKLAAGRNRFDAVIPAVAGGLSLSSLANARLRVRGVCTGVLNTREQWAGIQLRVPGPGQIEVLSPAPADPFAVEARTAAAVSRGSLSLLGGQRLRVQGVVTLLEPGQAFYLQDATGALRVNTAQTAGLAPGMAVEAAGYAAQDGLVLRLEEALTRPAGAAGALKPLSVGAEGILPQGRHHQELVQIEGRLVADAGGTPWPTLLVRSGARVFAAQFAGTNPAGPYPVWKAGSLARLTGVCLVQTTERNEPRAFGLVMRNGADFELLESPPWWTMQHALALGGGLLALVLAVAGWARLLGRQVRAQTADLHRRLEAEASLEKRLSLVWEISADGMRMTDAQGRVVRVNEAYCRLVDKPRDQVEGQLFPSVYQEPERERATAAYRQRFERREIRPRLEYEGVLWNGRKVWFELANVFYEPPGEPPLLLSQFRDVSQRKKAEAEHERLQTQLVQAQKMESVGRLAGGVAHDFNNMLQVILGNTSLALDRLPPESPVQGDLQEILTAAKRSAALTRQLLAFARKQTVSPKILDLNATLGGMLKMLERLIGEDIRLVWSPGPALWPVRMDPAQIDQILANLAANARDAIESVGTLTIATANQTVTTADLAPGSEGLPGDYVRLSVTDTGRGISAEVREHLFEPFYTTKGVGRGTGLGLATVYGIVKQNHGWIEVESPPGQGATLRIFLPRSQDACAPDAPLPDTNPRQGVETLLIVEDEPQILTLAQRVLEQHGYQVLAARGPEEALGCAQRHPGPIHLLVTDVVMPGMDGQELRRRLELLKPGLRCLFMSGYAATVIAKHGVLEDGVDFLQKPFLARELARRAREILDESRGAPGAAAN